MLDSLFIAATGLNAQQTNIDVISNNIANVNTAGYKKSKVDFNDLLYKETMRHSSIQSYGEYTTVTGIGVSATNVQKVFDDGSLKETSKALDLAISGNGFFEVMMNDGTAAYTRTGIFSLNKDGYIVDKNGNYLSSMVQLPPDFEEIYVTSDGVVSVKLPLEENAVEVGRIELASFVNPNGLKPTGNNMYITTENSGDPIIAAPGEIGVGVLSQGYFEASNVEYVEELTDLMLAQRTYEMNSKMLQASDQLMSIINNLYQG